MTIGLRGFTPRAVFLDFDGVVLESVDIKTEAFGDLFPEPRSLRAKVVAYHLKHAGVSRFDKFRHIHEKFLKRPLSPAESAALGRRFSGLVFAKVVKCPFVPGARRFLHKISRRTPIYLLSATPASELKKILRLRGLARYFKGVYGSPVTKAEAAKAILKRRGYDKGRVLFVGDAKADWKAARAAGVKFCGRVRKGRSPFPKSVPVVRDMKALLKELSGS